MDFFPGSSPNPLPGDDRGPGLDRLDRSATNLADRYGAGSDQPQPVTPATKKAMQKIFVIFLVVGLAFGALLSVGVVILLNHLGLTGVPARTVPGR